MKIGKTNFVLFCACLAAMSGIVSGKNGNQDYDYFDGKHEIINPRTLPFDIDGDHNETVEVVVMYDGYSPAVHYALSLFDESGNVVNVNVKPTNAVISEKGLDGEFKMKYKSNKLVKKTALRTLDQLQVKKRRSFIMKFKIPLFYFPCRSYVLRPYIRLANPVTTKTFTPLPLLYWPRKCRHCYSYALNKMANHGQTLRNCGGRSCSCYDGTLTCNAKCKYRQAWHTLLSTKKQKYVNAINWLESQGNNNLGYHLGHTSGAANTRSYFKVLTDHLTYSSHAHGQSKFLPWHRGYLCEFEQLLQLYDVCLTLPYWYHPVDSVGTSYHVLSDAYLGDEIAPYGQLNSPWSLPPGFTSFSRGGNNNNTPLQTASQISSTLLSKPDFASYRVSSEYGSHHITPHVAVGGNMGNYQSPADPLFWLHHGFVDRTWDVWRNMSPANAASYDSVLWPNISPQYAVTVNDVISETGIFQATTTTYKTGQIPNNDHCAVCYKRPFTVVLWDEKFPFKTKINLDELLAVKVPQANLAARASNDPIFVLTLKSNPNVDEHGLVKLAKDGCKFILPEISKEFIERFNVDPSLVKKEVCDLIKAPKFKGNSTTVSIALDDVDDDECFDSTDPDKNIFVQIPISEDVLKASLLDECPSRKR